MVKLPSAAAAEAAAVPRRSDGNEGLIFHRGGETMHGLVDLGIARPALQRVEPARDVGIGLEAAADDFADLDDRAAEIVGDGDVVAAEILFVAENVIVEDLQPALRIVLAP